MSPRFEPRLARTADAELAIGVHLAHLRLLLRRALLDERLGLANIPHEVIRQHVDTKLHIAKDRRLLLGDCDELLTKCLGDGATAVEHGIEHRAQRLVSHLDLKHVLERLVRVLCDRIRVH